jgi:hypothetical protein
MSQSGNFSPLLKRGFDLHVHCEPSKFPRSQIIHEVAEDARAASMGGIVTKSHEWPTGPLAEAVNYYEPDLQIFGGVVLNPMAGGLSPELVETLLKSPATKLVWMPTVASQAHVTSDFAHGPTKLFGGQANSAGGDHGVTILDDRDELKPEVHEILDLISNADIALCTGHLSPKEVDKVVDAALDQKVKKILIQHVDVGIVPIPFEQQRRLAAKPGVILEKCYLACTDFSDKNVPLEKMADSIKQLGADNCALVTDYGQKHNKPPVQALSDFAEAMLKNGVTEDEIRTMLVTNPRKILGLTSK